MRFRKGTTDHDGDGRMGGSNKENTMAKAPAKRTTRTKAAEDKAALEAAKTDAATVMDPQTGMDVVHAEKPTKAALEAKKAETAEQFAEADEKGRAGKATPDEIAEATLSRSIRGW